MSAVADILRGTAGMVASAGFGTYNEASLYTGDQTGIYMVAVPEDPDRIITLTFVANLDHPSLPYGEGMLQVRGRGVPADPMDVETLLDSIAGILHGATNLTFGSTNVTQMLRRVSVPMGEDDHKRWSRADQYYLDYTVAPTLLRPAGGSW